MNRGRLIEALVVRASRPGPWAAALSGTVIALLGLCIPIPGQAERRAGVELCLAAALAWFPWVFLAPLAWLSGRPGTLVSIPKAAVRLAGCAVLVAPWASLIAMLAAYRNLEWYWDHVLGLALIFVLLGLSLGRLMASGEALLEEARISACKARELDQALRPYAPEHLWHVLHSYSGRAEREPQAVEQDLIALADGYRSWLERTRWLDGNPRRLREAEDPGHPMHRLLLRAAQRLVQPWVVLTASVLFLAFQSIFFLESPLKRMSWEEILLLETRVLFSISWTFAVTPLPWHVGCSTGSAFPAWPLGMVLAPFATVLRLTLLRWLGAPAPGPGIFLVGVLTDGLVGFWIARRESCREEVKEAEARNADAYARLLRAQLEPHALMNALNDLAELLREDPTRAARGLGDLADFHRRLQQMAGSTWTTLGEERAFLERYLAVTAIRLERPLTVEWRWDERADPIPIPPLLVQPLVENALKHGLEGRAAGGILRLVSRLHEDHLEVRVENPSGAPSPRRGTGVGLTNLRARLTFVYHGQARFEFQQGPEWTVARLQLPKAPA